MTLLTGTEPSHWHGADGRHKPADPRIYRGYRRRRWTPEERAYVQHLEAHEHGDHSLTPLESDHALVRTCLDYIANEEQQLTRLRELVLALRRELASGVPIEKSDAAAAVEAEFPSLGSGANALSDEDR